MSFKQRVLVVHNFYKESGGEDGVFRAEVALLRDRGHQVTELTMSNDTIESEGPLRMAVDTFWSRSSAATVTEAIATHRPDVAHFHNIFPRISPSAYQACRDAGIPVVQTLHNYRLMCPKATLFRDGKVCESCVGLPVAWPAVVHSCYRDDRAATAVTTAMLAGHRVVGNWERLVDVYVALSEFSRSKQIQNGLPAEKVVVKPNFVTPDPGVGRHEGGFALYVGRLVDGKGVRALMEAWKQAVDLLPLKLVGDGPMREEVQALLATGDYPRVELLGQRPRTEVLALMQAATLVVFPSEWYENFPLTIAESFACGTPILASAIGAMAEIVEHRRLGLLFQPGNAAALAEQVRWATEHPAEMAMMGDACRSEFELKYDADRNYEMLMGIYARAGARISSAVLTRTS